MLIFTVMYVSVSQSQHYWHCELHDSGGLSNAILAGSLASIYKFPVAHTITSM